MHVCPLLRVTCPSIVPSEKKLYRRQSCYLIPLYNEDKFNCMMIIIRKLHYPCNPIGKAATMSVRMDCYEKQLKQLETGTEIKVKITLG